MPSLSVSVVKFIDDHFPGFVECSLVDAHGQAHLFHEKVPVVSTERLGAESLYPRDGHLECRVREEWRGSDGQYTLRVSTDEPFHIESTTGKSEFVVASSAVSTVSDEDLSYLEGMNLRCFPCIAGPVLVAVAKANKRLPSNANCPYCGSLVEVEVMGSPPNVWIHRCACGKCNGSMRGL